MISSASFARGALLYAAMARRSAGKVSRLRAISWAYTAPAPLERQEPGMAAVPFTVQEEIRVFLATEEGIVALADSGPFVPRTVRSAWVCAARAAAGMGFDGVALSGAGTPDRIFLLDAGPKLLRVEEAFNSNPDEAGDG